MTLYRPGHPARERAIDDAYRELSDLQASEARPLFTFLGDEVVFGRLPLRELKAWDWASGWRSPGSSAWSSPIREPRGIRGVSRRGARPPHALHDRHLGSAPNARSSIRFGAVGVRGGDEQASSAIPTATINYSLSEEADTIRWVQEEVQARGTLPLTEAEAVVRSLVDRHARRTADRDPAAAAQGVRSVYHHPLDERRGARDGPRRIARAPPRDVRAFGVAGLLHDIGKVKIPLDVLTKPGRFTDTERALMNRHPAEGARIILRAEEDLDLAAVVAYEHHIMPERRRLSHVPIPA